MSSISTVMSGCGKLIRYLVQLQQYLLENSLSTTLTTKVSESKSCIGMFSCVKVLCVTTTAKNITKKSLIT